MAHPPLPARANTAADGFPRCLNDVIKKLGVSLGYYYAMDARVKTILEKAELRRGTLAKVAHSSWGLET